MSKIAFSPNSSGTGTFTIASPNSNTNRTLTLPDADGALLTANGDGSALTGVGLGNSQTWQDVSGSRTSLTSYQNTTGKTIFWGASGTGSGTFALGQVSPDNSSWVTIGRLHPSTGTSFSGPVPNGWYYKLNQSTAIVVWAELR